MIRRKPPHDMLAKFVFAMAAAATIAFTGLTWFLLYLRGTF